jgi:PKHD-type hydroxylase
MMTCISGLLSRDQVAEIRKVLGGATFIDGKATAGYRAKRVKNNEQLQAGSSERKQLMPKIIEALTANRDFRTTAWPKRIGGMLFSRYGPGMQYGAHVDNAIMAKSDNLRTDVAFTVFLSEPAEYDGGELVIESSMGTQEIKLAAGDAVAYPASTLHRVAEVTRGERLVAAGWVQSFIRDPAKREILRELDQIKRFLDEAGPNRQETDLLFKTHANLLRMWSDD